ncbi:g6191 [Coccomyxa viridis]|uniref:G6191 protein n=1 Tax=Coccomyxa viridis TaxID=1274662 RepID=A0ABP1G1D8_9CHLO
MCLPAESRNRGRHSRRQVQPAPRRLAPPTPDQRAESAPSRTQRGKRARETTEVASPDAEQQTVPCTGSDHDVHPLESAIHNSALPEGPDQAARPAKRSRPATPERSAGAVATAPPAYGDPATIQLGHRGSPIVKQKPIFSQHSLITAQQELAFAQSFAVEQMQGATTIPPATAAPFVGAAPTAPRKFSPIQTDQKLLPRPED